MLWKRPNLTQSIASVSVRQGPSRRPSVADQQRDCSPEGTLVIPCEWYVSSLWLHNPKIGNESGKFYSYWIRNIRTRFEIILNHLYLEINYSLIYTGYELFRQHSKLKNIYWLWKKYSYRILFSYQVRIYWLPLIVPRMSYSFIPGLVFILWIWTYCSLLITLKTLFWYRILFYSYQILFFFVPDPILLIPGPISFMPDPRLLICGLVIPESSNITAKLIIYL